ncbi:Rv3654c family TadE-like protein [Paramicrobacterium agarici]|uniref:Rv3654c family TadE-like protein n=1 Tax=Paramicrobacterium agarici TaxID=630514 RepID=UPI00116EB1AF|nr:Rv3654c family TadE-like protein [Microbacterium agarici]TQO23744.1 secretion/DNA translocation related TadE-like protein [Microbacterium agarici]
MRGTQAPCEVRQSGRNVSGSMRVWRACSRRAHRRLANERGAASVLAIALVAATLIAVGILAPLCSVYAARQAVAGAADAAALAAADTASGLVAGVPCEAARRAADLNGAALDDCSVEGLVALVRVSTTVLGLPVAASARAGPPQL